MKKFAYIDNSGILHIVTKKEDAEKYSRNGKVVETDILSSKGYPLADGDEIIVYSETEMKKEANNKILLDINKYPHLSELYKNCK